ncbi:MAG: glycosyltransferase, partial [Pseudomonadota bacterium]
DHIGGGAERPRLETLAEELGLGARLTWHGPQDQARVLEAYRNADIFVLASQATAENDRDGLPNVLVEAASQGLACVATRFSAIPELIEDGTSGLLVPPGDAAALADALRTAARAPGLRQRLGRAAEDRVRREFDADPGIRRLKRLFEESWAEATQEPFSDRSDRETRPRTRESRP